MPAIRSSARTLHDRGLAIVLALPLLSMPLAARSADDASLAYLAAPGAQVLDTPAIMVRDPLHASYQTVTRAGPRLVAGGEHGLIILSDDNGVTWRQAQVPVSAGILTIRFANPQIGWAIGAFGVVLHTVDGGVTWSLQLDGIKAAAIMVATATALPAPPVVAAAPGTPPVPVDPTAVPVVPQRLRRALSFKTDGPDKPFLVLQVLDTQHVRVIGAYDMAFETSDGGATWTEWDQRIDDPRDLHPYGIAGTGASTIIAGEQGLLIKGDPATGMKAVANPPYDGSYFGAADGGTQGLFAFGLLGHLYRSSDGGTSWTAVDDPSKATLTCGLLLGNGQMLFADLAGAVWRLSGNTLTRSAASQPWPITDMAEAADGSLVVSGIGGIARVNPTVVGRTIDANG